MSLKSFAEAGERLYGPDVDRELVPPIMSSHRAISTTWQNLL